jgi:hypothetical protein
MNFVHRDLKQAYNRLFYISQTENQPALNQALSHIQSAIDLIEGEIAIPIPLKPRPKDWFFRIAKRADYKGRR